MSFQANANNPPSSPEEGTPAAPAEEEILVLPTKGAAWSLNRDAASGKNFWWNRDYRISTWQNHLTFPSGTKTEDLDDTDIWKAYLQRQDESVYKQCGLCNGPQDSDDMFLCCYCGNAVHIECSKSATPEQKAWKDANATMLDRMRCCFTCDAMPAPVPPRAIKPKEENVRRILWRIKVLLSEYPKELQHEILSFEKRYPSMSHAEGLECLRDLVARHFQKDQTSFRHCKIDNKGGGVGIRANCFIPKFTPVGIYPGYLDVMSGEQCKVDRPTPKYSLVDMNCADYFNRVFPELAKCITPFLNEPLPTEFANCAWIQETTLPEGRLSVMTVRDIQKDEEVMIGYGPLYPRTYEFNYDAYAFHPVDGYTDPPCFALWHWKTTDENAGELMSYVGYDAAKGKYYHWDKQDT